MLPALTAHLVGVPAVVTHHLKALIWNVLRDRCDKIARAEHLKVALDLRVHSRAIENRIVRTIHLHLRNRKRIANNVLREALDILTLIRRDATALVYVESRMHPTAQHARSIRWQQSNFDQELDHARTEQLLQRRVIAGKKRVCRATLFLSEFASEFVSAHHMKPALAVKQTVGNQCVQVRMEVEIFAEGVDRHNDGWDAVRLAKRIPQKVTH